MKRWHSKLELFQTGYSGEFYNEGYGCCRLRSDKEGVDSNSSFMNLVWLQDGFGQWTAFVDSGSIAQSEESRFDQ
jgi:hypothetical protein